MKRKKEEVGNVKKMYDKKRYDKNKDNINKRERERYKNNPETRRKQKERAKRKYEKNKDRIKEDAKKYYRNNKKKIRKTKNKWEKNNREKRIKYVKKYGKKYPERVRIQGRKRRAMKNNIIETFSDKEWLQKLKDTFGVCPKCNKYVGIHKLTLDHIHSISKAIQGQIYTIDDVQPLCKSCNCGKGNR
uniref:Putative homing endonuclease n=1 Tax=viral metagenome TaxID=1070528 RepID=A0A6H1ZJH3_9ZZZZ